MRKIKKITLWVQAVLIILCWASPFFLNWKLILLGIAVYYLQIILLKEDFFTKMNFGSKERGEITFYSYVLEKIGIKIDRKRMQLIADFIFPWVILLIAIYWQKIF
ncbi:MAG: hypothetical protein V1860_02330 [bacterium]